MSPSALLFRLPAGLRCRLSLCSRPLTRALWTLPAPKPTLGRIKQLGSRSSTYKLTRSSPSPSRIRSTSSLAALEAAYEVVDPQPSHRSNLLLTCEHASHRLPPEFDWPEEDTHSFVGKHWSYDIGAEICTRELSLMTGSPAILTRFSRLLLDPNRALDSDTMFREHGDGQKLQLNQNITSDEKQRRIARYYTPYHSTLHQLAGQRPYNLALSLHSYTSLYEGQPRAVEIGILYKHPDDQQLAELITQMYNEAGVDCRVNEPWSGKDGYMYAVDQVRSQLRPAEHRNYASNTIMLEFRNDLLVQPQWRQRMLQLLVDEVLVPHCGVVLPAERPKLSDKKSSVLDKELPRLSDITKEV